MQKTQEAGDMTSIYTTPPTHKSLVHPEKKKDTVYPGSQGFPNSENPTLQNYYHNATEGIQCVPLKFSPVHGYFKYNKLTQSQSDKPQKHLS
jgi:hypothetical protein